MTARSEKCSSANVHHVYVLILRKREKVRSASALVTVKCCNQSLGGSGCFDRNLHHMTQGSEQEWKELVVF